MIVLTIIGMYLVFGFGFYLGLALKDPKGFINADVDSMTRGMFLGILFWPVGLIVQTHWAINKLSEPKEGDE